jgi:hypothetical protein
MLNRGNSLCEHYEALRAQATGEYRCIATPRGLALFLRQGMPGWMLAWLDCASVTRLATPEQPADKGNRLPGASHSEVAMVLVSMALRTQQEVQLC